MSTDSFQNRSVYAGLTTLVSCLAKLFAISSATIAESHFNTLTLCPVSPNDSIFAGNSTFNFSRAFYFREYPQFSVVSSRFEEILGPVYFGKIHYIRKGLSTYESLNLLTISICYRESDRYSLRIVSA